MEGAVHLIDNIRNIVVDRLATEPPSTAGIAHLWAEVLVVEEAVVGMDFVDYPPVGLVADDIQPVLDPKFADSGNRGLVIELQPLLQMG